MPLSTHRIVRALSILAICVLSVLACAQSARAQGTQGIAPDPLTTGKLADYISWYLPDATPAQLMAIDAAHEEYLIAFRGIRSGPIEQLLKTVRAETREADKITDIMRQIRLVMRAIADADDRLFANIHTIMGPEQAALVQRARDARERECLSGMQMMSMDGGEGVPDLGRLIAARKLPAPQQRQAFLLLADNDSRVTEAHRQVMRESEEFGLKLATRMMELQAQLESGATDWSVWETTMMEMVEKEGGPLLRSRAALRQALESGVEVLRPVLDASDWHAIGVTVASRLSSGMIPLTGDPPVGGMMRRALKKENLDASQLESLRHIEREWADADLRLAREALDLNAMTMPNMLMGSRGEELHAALNAIHERRSDLARTTWDRIASILGDQTMQRYVSRDGNFGEAMPFGEVDDDVESEAERRASDLANENGARAANGSARYSAYFAPLSSRELVEVMEFVGIDDAQRTILEQAHAAYLERFIARIEAVTTRVADAQNALYSYSTAHLPENLPQEEEAQPVEEAPVAGGVPAASTVEASESDSPVPVQIAQSYAPPVIDKAKVDDYINAQIAAFDVALSLDAEFAAECTAALGAQLPSGEHASAPMIRSLRILDMLTKGGHRYNLASEETTVTPMDLCAKMDFDDAGRAAFSNQCAVELATRLSALQALARGIYEGSRRSEFLWQNIDGEATQDPQAGMRRYQEWRVKEQALEREGGALIRAVLDAAVAKTSKEVQSRAEEVRRRLMHPAVFHDPRAATPMLQAALALTDLDAQRRGQIEALFAEYQMLYDDVCEKLLALPALTVESENDPRYWAEQSARAMEFERLRFERGERSAKAVASLRRILGDANVVRVPGLSAYDNQAGVPDSTNQ